MSSVIARMLEAIFPSRDMRVLLISLDAAGKTTILYKLKLGEVVTTIPTIGFNVETYMHQGTNITFWDVGGCDKIRPLWRHYYQNTQGVIFVVDSNDRVRITEVSDELRRLMAEETLRDTKLLIYANKQDLPDAMTAVEISALIQLDELQAMHRVSPIYPCCALTGDGLLEGLNWLIATTTDDYQRPPDSDSPPPSAPPALLSAAEEEAKRHEDLLTEWLLREDAPDDLFLQQLEDCSLDSWDHRTHLRIAWLYLSRLGRRQGLEMIFQSIKHFIATSPRTVRASGRGTTFHETMTYFWAHMVHYAMVATRNPNNKFKTFLLLNPQFVNGGLFLHYYSKQRMLMDADARVTVLLPDIRPLPSIVSGPAEDVGAAKLPSVPVEQRGDIIPQAPLTDEEFLWNFEDGTLRGWGHDSMLRVVYLMLLKSGRSGHSANVIIDTLAKAEGDYAHLTLNYFWLQMVTYYMSALAKNGRSNPRWDKKDNSFPDREAASCKLTFNEFMAQPLCQPLRNQLLYLKYYSKDVIDRGAYEFAVPDKKELPTIV